MMMDIRYSKFIIPIIFTMSVFLLTSISFVGAQAVETPPAETESVGLASDHVGINYKLENRLNVDTIEGLLSALLSIFLVIATPIIVLFIIYAGFLYVTAKGNAEQTKQATKALTYAIIGGVILLGSVAIAEIVKNVVDAFRT